MKLEEIGFYTLNDARARSACLQSPMYRCEILLTGACNFSCPYCRGIRPDYGKTLLHSEVKNIIDWWSVHTLRNIRFSGGEPTVYPHILDVVEYAKMKGVERIAISTNGSADMLLYYDLISAGVNDFSISLDACCSLDGKRMSGGIEGAWEKVVENIKEISQVSYVTVGIVFTQDTVDQSLEIIRFASDLGVDDIRVISAAQYDKAIKGLEQLEDDILNKHPILKYRVNNYRNGRNVRGIQDGDSHRCALVQDDSAVVGNYHFPCVIYLREQGDPIGKVNPWMRWQRMKWFREHDTHQDPICKKNCLDVCIDYNNRWRRFNA
jgi:molybdenum cofactor biosynthesis enzyme MoaA